MIEIELFWIMLCIILELLLIVYFELKFIEDIFISWDNYLIFILVIH